MKPSIGRIVVFKSATEISNGAKQAPAIITRVWSDVCVNLTVFPDAGLPFARTSVMLEGSAEMAELWAWPERV